MPLPNFPTAGAAVFIDVGESELAFHEPAVHCTADPVEMFGIYDIRQKISNCAYAAGI